METRSIHRAPEIRSDGDKFVIGGYAAVFYRAGDPSTEYELWPGTVERIAPTAFDEAVKVRFPPVALIEPEPADWNEPFVGSNHSTA